MLGQELLQPSTRATDTVHFRSALELPAVGELRHSLITLVPAAGVDLLEHACLASSTPSANLD